MLLLWKRASAEQKRDTHMLNCASEPPRPLLHAGAQQVSSAAQWASVLAAAAACCALLPAAMLMRVRPAPVYFAPIHFVQLPFVVRPPLSRESSVLHSARPSPAPAVKRLLKSSSVPHAEDLSCRAPKESTTTGGCSVEHIARMPKYERHLDCTLSPHDLQSTLQPVAIRLVHVSATTAPLEQRIQTDRVQSCCSCCYLSR